MITALVADGARRHRVTFSGVRAGDAIELVAPSLDVEFVGTASLSVGARPGAAVYVFETGCSSLYTADVADPIALEIRSNCLDREGALNVLVSALDENASLLAVTSTRNAEWRRPMSVSMTVWRDVTRLDVEAARAPPGTVGFLTKLAYDTAGVIIEGPSTAVRLAPGQRALLAVVYAPEFADQLVSESSVLFGSSIESIDGSSAILERSSSPPAARSFDLSVDCLPQVFRPATDPIRRRVVWTSAEQVSNADAAIVSFDWTERGSERDSWVVITAATATSAQMPSLPEDLIPWAPGWTARFEPGRVQIIDADWMTSYDQFRNEFRSPLQLDAIPLPDGGRLRVAKGE
ncbi:MAG: hypothetical protein HY791_15140 [Deltaproteobacteria bacterium]|nr:hypothetical protein [Deltaproteobacteria bacterium]